MIRKAAAAWQGSGRSGSGTLSTDSGVLDNTRYSFRTRFENEKGTNPEELIAAAHAACFSMAVAAALTQAGHPPRRIHTAATVNFGPVAGGFAITKIELQTEGEVPGIDAAKFAEFTQAAKVQCPVSKALAAVEISLAARLL